MSLRHMADSEQSVRPRCIYVIRYVSPAASVFHHISGKRRLSSPWPQIWLLAHALNALHACGGTRVVRQVSDARDPQRWGRQKHSTWPSWWCGPFRLLQVCRVPARTRIKDGSLNGPTTWRVTSAGGLSWATASCRTTGNVTRAAFGSMRSRLAVRVTLLCHPFHPRHIIWPSLG